MKARRKRAIRKALNTGGRLFFLAAFLWGFYAAQAVIAQINFQTGYEYGVQSCQKPKYKTGSSVQMDDTVR